MNDSKQYVHWGVELLTRLVKLRHENNNFYGRVGNKGWTAIAQELNVGKSEAACRKKYGDLLKKFKVSTCQHALLDYLIFAFFALIVFAVQFSLDYRHGR